MLRGAVWDEGPGTSVHVLLRARVACQQDEEGEQQRHEGGPHVEGRRSGDETAQGPKATEEGPLALKVCDPRRQRLLLQRPLVIEGVECVEPRKQHELQESPCTVAITLRSRACF